MKRIYLTFPVLFLFLMYCHPVSNSVPTTSTNYQDLVTLFKSWRTFETPPFRDGAPDYTAATFEKRLPEFKKLQEQLLAIDYSNWPIEQQVDWRIVWAEMNGYGFNHRILKPWVRDPAFYTSIYTERSDVPAHEGPTHHGITDIWTYTFPLAPQEKTRLLNSLKIIPPLNEQAKLNLTGNAKELWIAGIRPIEAQSNDLEDMFTLAGVKEDAELTATIKNAINSTNDLVSWLTEQAKTKTGLRVLEKKITPGINSMYILYHLHGKMK